MIHKLSLKRCDFGSPKSNPTWTGPHLSRRRGQNSGSGDGPERGATLGPVRPTPTPGRLAEGPGMRGPSALLRGVSCRPGCRVSFPPYGEARIGAPVRRSPVEGRCGCLHWLSWCVAASPRDNGTWMRPTKSHAVPYRTDQVAYKPSAKGPPYAAVRLGPLRLRPLWGCQQIQSSAEILGMKGKTVESGEIRPVS